VKLVMPVHKVFRAQRGLKALLATRDCRAKLGLQGRKAKLGHRVLTVQPALPDYRANRAKLGLLVHKAKLVRLAPRAPPGK
jgi:hypothetical protein